jgi:LytS/YehU family sensor histidine kinase
VQATLGAQLDIVRAYLGLMAARMPRLQFGHDPAELLAAHCPPLMLISLAENAVKHGVERKIGPARVDVSAARDDQGRPGAVTVADDGARLRIHRQRQRPGPGQHPRAAGSSCTRAGRTAAEGPPGGGVAAT